MGRNNKDNGKEKISVEEKQHSTTEIDMFNLGARISRLEEVFANLKKRKLQQQNEWVFLEDEASSDDEASSEVWSSSMDSSETLIKYLSEHDLQFQFPKQQEQEPVKTEEIKTEVEEAKPAPVKTEQVNTKCEEPHAVILKTKVEDPLKILPLAIIYPD